MATNFSLTMLAPRLRTLVSSAAVLVAIFVLASAVCLAQTTGPKNESPIPSPESTPKPAGARSPLTDSERAELLELIRTLQERVSKLEAAQAQTQPTSPAQGTVPAAGLASVTAQDAEPQPAAPVDVPPATKQTEERKEVGTYTPGFGFKLADTKSGDLSVSIMTYGRYLNQRGLDSSYTDAFGNTKSVQQRQDFQLQKMQIKFLGWIVDPKLRYFLYVWTSNANWGQGGQVVLGGNVNYTFNKHLNLFVGINGLPGVRSIEGNFPYWLSVDSRLIADEFFRGSYTSGIWAKGEITDKLRYQVMLGNNLSSMGVPAVRLDKGLNTVAGALIWTPTTGEFGAGFGDFEDHKKLATRLAVHFSRSNENKESQPNSDAFENTQLRLSDGSVIFTPDLFGPGIEITDARYRMTSFDGGLKYRGYALEGEYYLRWLDNFRGPGTGTLGGLFDHGYQLQASAMVVPKTLQVYAGQSKIFGQYGNPWDFRAGVNFFPWKNRVVTWNNEWLYLKNSPVGYTSVPFALGGRGNVFHSSFLLNF